jgi:hypothetical protein
MVVVMVVVRVEEVKRLLISTNGVCLLDFERETEVIF